MNQTDRARTSLDAPICIIGAGMSGILAAERLRGLGYRHIDLIDAQAQPGGLTETVEVDGKVFDFQAHLLAMQDFGRDMTGTAVQELLDKYLSNPAVLHDESLYFVTRTRSGNVRMGIPPNFYPFIKSLSPDQIVDQLVIAWNIVEGATRNRTRPGVAGLAFDRTPGETWESFRARHPPLVGQALQSIAIYANMRRPWQPAEFIINANAQIPGNLSQLAKAVLAIYPELRERLLSRMPASLVAQIGSERPISQSFIPGFQSFLRTIAAANQLEFICNTRATAIRALRPDAVEVSFAQGTGAQHTRFTKTYARVIVTTRPMQTREMFAEADIRALFSDECCPPAWTRSYLIKMGAEALPFPCGPRGEEGLGFWLIDPYSNLTDTDVEQSLHRITAANKQHEVPYWMCFSNSDRSISNDEAWALAKDSLFMFKDPQLIDERISNWPVYVSAAAVRDGWFDKIEALQGRNGVYFVGEVMSGPTIESVSSYMRDVIPLWFGAR